MDSGLSRVLAPLWRRIELMLARGVVRLAKEGKCQYLQLDLLAGETRDKVERFEEYGFASALLPGCEAAVMFVGGHRGHGIVVATADRRYRPNDLQAGETCLYTDEGDRITLRRGRVVEIQAGAKVTVTAPEVEIVASTSVTVDSPTAVFTGDVQCASLAASGAVADGTGTMDAMRQVFNAHQHTAGSTTTSAPTSQM
ncbi:phage baseplate assembly protein V [Desulfocurvibacter africanus]|uniref:phage baseplate assembly protein V n=1 Tax=Desulfocurvibacter africanus TaxID=873 RepID=UPI00041627AC|nr:phage baseplate assembly protein V [Desulfocurvibacter africanus]